MQRVVEAFKNQKTIKYEGTREVLNGLASDNMIIKIVIEDVNTITAYPDFKDILC